MDSTAKLSDIITALQDLTTINAKADLASVIGSPAQVSDTMATLVQDIQNSKDSLVTFLQGKGQSAGDTDPLASLVSAVTGLPVKIWASGTGTLSADSQSFQFAANTSTLGRPYLTVTGLTFKPTVIVAKLVRAGYDMISVYLELPSGNYTNLMLTTMSYGTSTNGNALTFKGDVSPASVTSTGFTIPFDGNAAYGSSVNWIAF